MCPSKLESSKCRSSKAAIYIWCRPRKRDLERPWFHVWGVPSLSGLQAHQLQLPSSDPDSWPLGPGEPRHSVRRQWGQGNPSIFISPCANLAFKDMPHFGQRLVEKQRGPVKMNIRPGLVSHQLSMDLHKLEVHPPHFPSPSSHRRPNNPNGPSPDPFAWTGQSSAAPRSRSGGCPKKARFPAKIGSAPPRRSLAHSPYRKASRTSREKLPEILSLV